MHKWIHEGIGLDPVKKNKHTMRETKRELAWRFLSLFESMELF